ncbi:MAG TPA: NEW3 domain-containing protein [Candidatus Limnocylindrales bacterium]
MTATSSTSSIPPAAPKRRLRRAGLALALAGLATLQLAPSIRAAGGVEISTPYAAVAVEPGNTASFDLNLASNVERRVSLAVTAVPQGWDATIRGGGFIVDGVTAGPSSSPELSLDVDVPEDAADGTYRISIRANGGGAAVDTLDLDLRVAAAAGGEVTLTTDNPALRDDANATFPFSLSLKNDTPRQLTFSLSTESPGAGWSVDANPSGQTQAASFQVDAGAQETISVSVDPPDTVAAGAYPIKVTATSGDVSATADLAVEIVGNTAYRLSTPDQNLRVTASAGQRKDFQVLVINDGTAPVNAVTLSATPPQGWNVEFEPETVDQVGTDAPQTVNVHLTPSGSAIAGDYAVTVTATTADGGNETLELRVTVETSQTWFLVGIGLIVLVLVGLSWVFQRYGRR